VNLLEISRELQCVCPPGSEQIKVNGISSLESATEDTISFVVSAKYSSQAQQSKAGVLLVVPGTVFENKVCLEVNDPYLAYARVAQLFEDTTPPFGAGISSEAVISETAQIADTASVGPKAVIGERVLLGPNTQVGACCVIEPGVVIGHDCRIDSGAIIRRNVHIGDRVIIQSNAVIGSEGFGNARDGHVFVRIPCFGAVIIEDDAEIGAGTTIDRGNFEPTIIGKGTRIDNQVMIAHNVEIGENTAIAAQAGLSGSTTVGKRVIIAGQAGFAGHFSIGDDAFIGAKAGVSKAVEAGQKITGYPARDLMQMRRVEAAQLQLPAMLKEFKKLKSIVEKLQNENDG